MLQNSIAKKALLLATLILSFGADADAAGRPNAGTMRSVSRQTRQLSQAPIRRSEPTFIPAHELEMEAAPPCAPGMPCYSASRSDAEENLKLLHNIAIVGRDDRVAQSRARGSEFAPVGIIRNHSLKGARSTAFLVSECHVLTVAHGIVGDPVNYPEIGGLQGWPEDRTAVNNVNVEFSFGQSNNGPHQPFAGAVSGRVVMIGNFSPENRDPKEDFALLEVAPCVGREYGFVQPIAQSFDSIARRPGSVLIAGHPGDKSLAAGVQVQSSCSLREIRPGPDMHTWKHDCDTWAGSSGSPLMIRDGNRLFAIGMATNGNSEHHPEYRSDQANLAASMVYIMRRIRPIIQPRQMASPGT